MDLGTMTSLAIILGSPIQGRGRNMSSNLGRERVQTSQDLSSIPQLKHLLQENKSKIFIFYFKCLQKACPLDYCYCSNFQEFSGDLLLCLSVARKLKPGI